MQYYHACLVFPKPQYKHPGILAEAVVEALQFGDALASPLTGEAPAGVIVTELNNTTTPSTDAGTCLLPVGKSGKPVQGDTQRNLPRLKTTLDPRLALGAIPIREKLLPEPFRNRLRKQREPRVVPADGALMRRVEARHGTRWRLDRKAAGSSGGCRSGAVPLRFEE